MYEERLPDTKLNLMHEINNQHAWQVEVTTKSFDECILWYTKICLISIYASVDWGRTAVGTLDVSLRSLSTTTPPIGIPCLKIAFQASFTRSALYLQALSIWFFLSMTWPSWSSFDFSTRQRGHGQRPCSQIVASKTLIKQWAVTQVGWETKSLLLGIICRVGEDPWIHAALDSIITMYNHTIVECMKEIIIEQ